MKKKLSIIILSFVCAVSCALGFAACDSEKKPDDNPPSGHTHTYSQSWAYDAEQHWHECSCGAKQDTAKHAFKGGVCGVCEFEESTSSVSSCNHEKIYSVYDRKDASCKEEGYSLSVVVCMTPLENDEKGMTCGKIFADEYGVKSDTSIGQMDDYYRNEETFKEIYGNGKHGAINEILSSYRKTKQRIPHTPVIDEAVPATCSTKGLTEGSHCKVCSTVIKAQTETDFADHANTDIITFADSSHNVCAVCGQIENDGRTAKMCLNGDNNSYTFVEAGGEWTELDFSKIKYNGKSVTAIEKLVFLDGALIELNLSGVKSVGAGAFGRCRNLTNIIFGNDLEDIKSQTFAYCSSLTAITVPDNIKGIVEYAFEDCSSLKSVTLSSETKSNSLAFYGCPIETATIRADELETISAIKKDTLTTVIIVGDSICNFAFKDCSSLTSVTISDSVTSIGNSAFQGCSSLTSIIIGGSAIIASEPGSSNWPFHSCEKLKNITVDKNNPNYSSHDGILYNKAQTNFVYIPVAITGEVTIPNSIMSIGNSVFYGCSGLTSVTIGNSVTSIGNSAFKNCSSLTSITIPDGVTSVGDSVFSGCSSLQYNEYENGLYLGNATNKYVILVGAKSTDITSCNINENTKVIFQYAFRDCSSLTSITIPDGVTSVGDSVFSGCSNLHLNEYDNAYYLGNENNKYFALINLKDNDITSCTINLNAKIISGSAFRGCSGLTSITIPDGVTSIGNYAFYGCRGLTSVTIGNSVTSIDYDAFGGCSGLTSITFNGTQKQWDDVEKDYNWDYGTGNYTIHCTDGDITKN